MRLHRLIAVHGGRLQLRGDANREPDSSLVTPTALRGTAFLKVPWTGLPILWIRTGDLLPLLDTGLATAVLAALAVRSSTREPAVARRGRRRMRRTAPPAGLIARAAGLVLVAATLALVQTVQPTSQAGFTAASTNTSSTLTAGTFDCPSRAGLPAAYLYYSYMPASGTAEPDLSGSSRPGVLGAGATRVPGTCLGNGSPSVSVNGTSTGYIAQNTAAVTAPTGYSIALWFKTTTRAGKLAGFGNNRTTASTTYDRQLYLTAAGTLDFGMTLGNGTQADQVCAGTTVVTDGAWHLAVATYSANSLTLWLDDGRSECTAGRSGSESIYSGYWRFGYDALDAGSWAGATATAAFTGSLDETAIYGSALSQVQVRAIHAAGH